MLLWTWPVPCVIQGMYEVAWPQPLHLFSSPNKGLGTVSLYVLLCQQMCYFMCDLKIHIFSMHLLLINVLLCYQGLKRQWSRLLQQFVRDEIPM